jgi:hypothetical protein
VRLVLNCLSEEEFGLEERIALIVLSRGGLWSVFRRILEKGSILAFSKRPMAAVSDSFILPHTKSCP